MTILASVIINSALTTLLDIDRVTFSDDEMLGYLNEALRATAFVKPDMFVVQEFITPAAGVDQTLPAGGIALIDVIRNSNGRIISEVDRQLLDESNRFWNAGTEVVTVEHYTVDPRNPLRYRVFPPNSGAGSIEIVYGAVPATLTATSNSSDEIPVPDSYQNALTNFVLAKAYMKNSKKQDLVKSASAMQDWRTSLGLKAQAQIAISPKVAAEPGVA